jgi:metallo-beta-lactamase family protein
MKIKFLGAAKEVTGSKHLIITNNKRILLDCGMYQGKGMATDGMNRDLGFNPKEIDYLILSHAHIDHAGLIPYIYQLGFRGTIFCTPATRDLCAIMLADCAKIQEHDTQWHNKKRATQGLSPLKPIYNLADAIACMSLFVSIPYNKPFPIEKFLTIEFINSGHLLGSAISILSIREGDRNFALAYTGDIGRPVNRILIPPQPFPQADILIAESTYGDRIHAAYADADQKLLDVINQTCVIKKGKLIIPSFSVGRTQEVIYSLNNFYEAGKLPKIEVFVDSPLSVNATNIVRSHPECFNKDVMHTMEHDADPFGFQSLTYVETKEDSQRLNSWNKPCIIISASGMMEAGRVKHHLANSISDPKNTILAVGYCSPSTLGAKILRGDKQVSIFGSIHEVKAQVEKIESFSGHGDYKEMLDYLCSCQNPKKIAMTYLVHGEEKVQEFYRERMHERGFENVQIPERGFESEY